MHKSCRGLVVAIFSLVGLANMTASGQCTTLLPADKAAEIVLLRNVTVKDGEVTGEVVNNSKQTLRDVQLQITYSWRWKNEFQPGTDDPGRAVYHAIEREIPPGQTARFEYKPQPPLPSRSDGYFETTVKVIGFAQVYRQLGGRG
jgi:hypothetical protein